MGRAAGCVRRGKSGPCHSDEGAASCQAGRAAREAAHATQAPAAGRDAGRHARAAEAAAERRGGAGHGQAQVPRERRGERLRQPVPHHPPGKGGHVNRVRTAEGAGVAARGRGQRLRELVPRHADRHAARRAR
eukprot:scaffold51293_cov30-Phaeocystis_antarctica.AAC.1